MTAIIIEDEKPAARLLQRKLERIGISAAVMLHSVAESVDWFHSNPHPDLIFLDIQLSDGLSFEIFESVDIKTAVIFTTAYDEYALKAFKLNSIDYLLKPIDEDELKAAIDKFERTQQAANAVPFDLASFRKLFSGTTNQFKKRFTVKVGQHLRVIATEDIECIYSENKATYIHTVDNRDYPIESTLESLEQELDPAQFFRISRKFLIPMKSVREIAMYSNSRLKVSLPTYKADEVIVSREKVSDFRNWLS
ncbi:MAG: response regulator transcription factor [Flavobacterium sp.]|nr:MAG: response regulator transcription factor [Flavobacterium sp.]